MKIFGRQAVLLIALCLVTSWMPAVASEFPVLSQIGFQRGVCVVIGDASLPLHLAQSTELIVYLQSPDLDEVSRVREEMYAAGLLGSRVYVDHGELSRIHFADNVVDAVVVRDPSMVSEALKTEALRVLHPGGKLIYGSHVIVKPIRVGADEWSHPYHGPDNNPQSDDQFARGPFLTKFMAKPWYSTLPQMTVIAGGRIFKVFGNRASARPQWPVLNTMICLNAYNGTELWRKPIKSRFMLHRNTLIATPDVLYFGDDESCKLIDPATGEVLSQIVLPKGLSDGSVWKWMALVDGVLYALVGEAEPAAKSRKGNQLRGAGWGWRRIENYLFGMGRTILAIDPKSKQVLWSHHEQKPIDARGLCMNNRRIFFYIPETRLHCLHASTGETVWTTTEEHVLDAIGKHTSAQSPNSGFASSVYLKCTDDALYFAGPQRKRIVCVSARNGELLWQRDGGNSQLVLHTDGIYALGEGVRNKTMSSFKLDPRTGEELVKFPSRDGCTRATGCIDAIFTRGGKSGSTAMFNTNRGKPMMSIIGPMRPACQDGVVVAHGQLYWGPWRCSCDATQIGVICLEPSGEFDHGTKATDDARLVSGSAESNVSISKQLYPQLNDWPTYRKDNSCTTYSNVKIHRTTKVKWTYRPLVSNVATAPVTVGNTIFVGGSDGVIRAIHSKTGESRWTAFTGSNVQYPPVIHNGCAFVGSGDGCVYCFDAGNGKLRWKFRAAPIERKIPIYGSIMSTWPVGGGILVDGDEVFAIAGNANYDGTHAYCLDSKTGRIIWQNNTVGHLDSRDSRAGVQSHLLLHDDRVYMSGGAQAPIVSFDRKNGRMQPGGKGRGRNLFLIKGEVRANGNPLYWRPEDEHYITDAAIRTARGHVTVLDSNVITRYCDRINEEGKTIDMHKWFCVPYQEINAIAVGQNAVVVAGIDRKSYRHDTQTSRDDTQTSVGVCAYDLANGQLLWEQSLPSPSVSFGIAIDRSGCIVVSLQNGDVVFLDLAKHDNAVTKEQTGHAVSNVVHSHSPSIQRSYSFARVRSFLLSVLLIAILAALWQLRRKSFRV